MEYGFISGVSSNKVTKLKIVFSPTAIGGRVIYLLPLVVEFFIYRPLLRSIIRWCVYVEHLWAEN